MIKGREPTGEEFVELIDWLHGLGHDFETALSWCSEAGITVFDHYMSDGPGYAGKVMLVVWPGGPELISSFTWSQFGDFNVCAQTK